MLDVLLRRLDGENFYEGVIPDEKGAEWRKFTNETAINTDGIPVQTITKQYTTYRTTNGNNDIEGGMTQEIEKSKHAYIDPTYP
ncbi:MAG: hypothetical protein LBG59_02680 [Candidatus Peribacteria bacterium]|nr:hypothetical protein [Candidatus Peribacteria bacterium]